MTPESIQILQTDHQTVHKLYTVTPRKYNNCSQAPPDKIKMLHSEPQALDKLYTATPRKLQVTGPESIAVSTKIPGTNN